MMYNEIPNDKKRQNNLLTILQNGKYHFLNSMGYNSNKKECIAEGIFGKQLEIANLYGSTNKFGLKVPEPVYRCFKEILARGLLTEGIFRLSGTAPDVETLYQEFDKPRYGKPIDLADYDIHAVTGVVKKYLRSLPDPVVPLLHQNKFIQIYGESYPDKSTIYKLSNLIQTLPKEHFHLIHYIIYLSSEIQHNAHSNMMNPEALAIVLAPVCTGLEQNLKQIPSSKMKKQTRSKLMNDMGHFIETNAKWTEIWTLLISYSDILLEDWKDSIQRCLPSNINHTIPFFRSSASDKNSSQKFMINIVSSPGVATHDLMRKSVSTNTKSRKKSYSDDLYRVVVIRSRPNTLQRNRQSANFIDTCSDYLNPIPRSMSTKTSHSVPPLLSSSSISSFNLH